uniref:Uncharacterized protein n=1 Tax=Setaria digitata TaxID=48799 RepID=A0A915Q5S9_9BILA
MEGRFVKSGSRYQFNINRIEQKYCNGPNRREMAIETLQRNFGEACISSPVVEAKNKTDKAICKRLNQIFEDEYGKRMRLDIGHNVGLDDCGTDRNSTKCLSWEERFASVCRDASKNIPVSHKVPNITNLLTDSVKEESYEPGHDEQIQQPIILTGQFNPFLVQDLDDEERLSLAKNEAFLDAWFRNVEVYWRNSNFARDHSFRWRSAFSAQRHMHRNLGYIDLSIR